MDGYSYGYEHLTARWFCRGVEVWLLSQVCPFKEEVISDPSWCRSHPRSDVVSVDGACLPALTLTYGLVGQQEDMNSIPVS